MKLASLFSWIACVLLAAGWASASHAEQVHAAQCRSTPASRRSACAHASTAEENPPIRLTAESLDAAVLLSAQVEAPQAPRAQRGGLNLGSLPQDSCIAYIADIANVQRRHDRTRGPARRVGPDHLITDVGLWLWRPGALAEDEDIEVRFVLPEGVSASALEAGARRRWSDRRLPHRSRPVRLAGRGGVRNLHRARAGGGRCGLRVSLLHGSRRWSGTWCASGSRARQLR